MNSELENLKEWLHGNNISLNVAKTTSILIGKCYTLHDKITVEPMRANFEISGEPTKKKTSVKYICIKIKKSFLDSNVISDMRDIRTTRKRDKFLTQFDH